MEENEMQKLGLRKAVDQQIVQSENFVKVYANNVTLSASNWDMSLSFGEIIGLSEDGNPIVEQKVKVNMTREFIKALYNLLGVNIGAFEKQFGEIGFVNIDEIPKLQDVGQPIITKSPKPRAGKKTK